MTGESEAVDSRRRSSTNLLITEYERSSEFCNHVDNVRNVITSFFLTLVGAAAFAIDRYLSDDVKSQALGSPTILLSSLLGGIAVTGVLFIMTIARLRRIQTERYRIMNSILDAVLTSVQRDIVPFRNDRIPVSGSRRPFNKRLSGSYVWTVILILPTAATAGVSIYLAFRAGAPSTPILRNVMGSVGGIGTAVVCDQLFWRLSELRDPGREFDESSAPQNSK